MGFMLTATLLVSGFHSISLFLTKSVARTSLRIEMFERKFSTSSMI